MKTLSLFRIDTPSADDGVMNSKITIEIKTNENSFIIAPEYYAIIWVILFISVLLVA
jgi:hypothetical protein